jgi:signal peptidase I
MERNRHSLRDKLATLARQGTRELLTTVLPAVLIALLVNVFVAEAVAIEDGPSMQPNLYRGDRMLTEKISYRLHPPRRGDVVVVDRPGNQKTLVKRVIAVAGETVEVRGGHTWVDGQPVDEPWVEQFGGPGYGPEVVPEDHVFVLGDNRAVSHDSRAIGPVPVDSVRGHVVLVYWPPEKARLVP